MDSSITDLSPFTKIIGDARIVMLSEGVHGAAEPLAFRNRLSKYLVEELRFDAVILESGVAESRLMNDFVTRGVGNLDTAAKQGLTWTFSDFRPSWELISWLRKHNANLPAGTRPVQLLGFDVSGSPGNPQATRGPGAALEEAIKYLDKVDSTEATKFRGRAAPLLTNAKQTYEGLKESDRTSVTLAIADLITLIEHKRFQYIAKSSAEDYAWGERTAVAARQVDAWWRHMPPEWKPSKGFEWAREASQYRERAMADNLEWVLEKLGPQSRVLVFAAVGHNALKPYRYPDAPERDMYSFGTYVKARHGSEVVGVLNLVFNGEIKFCSGPRTNSSLLKPPPATSVENLFSSVGVPHYILDLRTAPPPVAAWLRQPQDHWNGFGVTKFATAEAFDVVFYTSSVTSACFAK